MLSEMLQRLREPSYNISVSETLSAGLDLLTNYHIDLVLLDPNLPDRQGLDALAEILKLPPNSKPVVTLVEDSDGQLCRDLINQGAYDYLVKGQFDETTLGRVLQRVMLSWEAGWRLDPRRGNLSKLIEMSPVGMIVTDSSSVVRFANSAARTMLGRSYHQMVGQPLDLNVPDGAPTEVAIRNAQGGLCTGEAIATETIWGHGPARLIMLQNITRRKLVEEELRLQSEVIKNMAEGIMVVRARDWTIVYTNSKFDEMFGYGPGELVGQNVSVINASVERAPEETAREIIDALEQQGEWAGEVHNVKKDGTPFWCYDSVSAFDHWDYGTVWVSIHTNIDDRKRAEDERARLAAIVESSEDAIIGKTLDGTIISWNQGAEHLYGYSAQEVVGRPGGFFTPPDRPDEVSEMLRRAGQGETIHRFDTQRMRKDGTLIDVSLTVSPITDSSGKIVGASSIAHDITQRKKAEEALQESEERFRSLLNSTPDGIVIVDNNARIQLVNAQTERMFGYSRQKLLDQPVEILLPERLAAGHVQLRSGYIADPSMRPMGTGLETIGRRKDGVEFPVDISLSPLETESGCLVISAIRDTTERKKAEEALQESEERFRSLVQSASSAIVIADEEGNIISWNQGARNIFGYGEEEVLGQPLTTLMPQWYHEDHQRGLERVRATGQGKLLGKTLELYALRKDGSEFPIQISLSSWQSEGGVFFSGMIHDITERKELESALQSTNQALEQRVNQLDQANADLERFAYVASHDLQEPLRMVSGFSQMLQEKYQDQLDADAREYIWYLVDAAGRMRNLIQDLLAFSRVQTRGRPLEMVNCEEVLGWVLSNLQAAIEEAQAVVTHDPLPEVMGDATQLMQVFQNLLANAMKFRKLEPPRVHISVEGSGEEFIFSVTDNGIGIEPEFHQRIFEIFQRLHTRDRYPGTGIGLAICQRIIDRHGGRIWVESEPGQGSTFYFSLPATEVT
jgi:PAS domain S-box-containing protein